MPSSRQPSQSLSSQSSIVPKKSAIRSSASSVRTTDALQMTPEALDATITPIGVDEDEALVAQGPSGIRKPEKPSTLSEDALLNRSIAYRQITTILLNGANSLHPNSDSRFLRHQPLMSQLIAAYRLRDKKMFLLIIEQYLKEAVMNIPQAGRADKIPAQVNILRQTIEQLENLQEWRRYTACLAEDGQDDRFFTQAYRNEWYRLHDTGMEIAAKHMLAASHAIV